MRSRAAVLAMTMIAACARNQPQLSSIAAVTDVPCDTDRLPADVEGEWRAVRGDGFTYCVPAAWRPIGTRARRWTSPSVDMTWGDPGGHEQLVPFVAAARGQTGAPIGQRVVTETIDGRTVRLEIMDGSDNPAWRAAAAWLEPSLRFSATARTASASREVLAVIRSVRFRKD